MTENALTSRLELAIQAGRAAAAGTLRYFQNRELSVERKTDGTPVTIADREAEAYLRERIAAAFPDDEIVGEELPRRPGRSGYSWILDPIDGTKAFIYGVPLYGTLIGVVHENRSVAGVVILPALEEYIYAARGQGAWHVRGSGSPRPARVSAVDRLAEALMITTEVREFDKVNRREAFEQLSERCRWTRGWGDCYGYVLVATGRAEVMIDPVLSIWDMAALPPILEEAGGTFTDWQGEPTILGRDGIGTNGRVLSEVLAVTRGR